MDQTAKTMEYQCPCCGAGLTFSSEAQNLKCEYCDNTFSVETARAYMESQEEGPQETLSWDSSSGNDWNPEESDALRGFRCSSCDGEIITDATTAATFCPYCGNPTILPSRLSSTLKPDYVLPFKRSKADARAAFLSLCKGKPLLPAAFTQEQQIEKITGLYVPFWLYDCSADFSGSYKATRVHHWSDSRYLYTKTDHFLLRRSADADFSGIPMDGSSKMDDTFMESIEPYDYTQLKPFDMSYLTGYYADKYDVPADQGEPRIRQRVEQTMQAEIRATTLGYTTAIPTSRQIQIRDTKTQYVLLPVWILNTKYRGKLYTFAMNGQSGKMTGSFPICPKRTALWFSGIFAGVTALAYVIQMLF